jgi:hypothetical protein
MVDVRLHRQMMPGGKRVPVLSWNETPTMWVTPSVMSRHRHCAAEGPPVWRGMPPRLKSSEVICGDKGSHQCSAVLGGKPFGCDRVDFRGFIYGFN